MIRVSIPGATADGRPVGLFHRVFPPGATVGLSGRVFRALLLALFLLATVPVAPAGADDAADQGRLADLARQAFAPRRIALLIGVDEVADHSFPPLSFATRDVDRLAGVLGDDEQGHFDQVETIHGASLDDAWESLAALMGQVRRQDTVLVYFSGHGMAGIDDEGVTQLYLALRDTSRGTIEESGLALHWVQDVFESLPARRKVLVVDACFVGEGKRSTLTGTGGAPNQSEAPLLRTQLPSDEAHLLAAGLGSPAFELDELGGSLYTVHFADALTDLRGDLDGDHVVTVSEAHDVATDAVVQASGGAQEPLALYRISGREDLVLAGDPEARSPSTMALLTTYDRRHAGLSLEVGGRAKGAFPRSILVEPGVQRVRLLAPSGEVVDRGVFRFKAGQVVSVERMRSSINGGFRFIHLTGAPVILPIPEGGGDAEPGFWIGGGLGSRARGKVGRHIAFRGEVGGGGVVGHDEGSWALLTLAVDVGLRFDPGRLSLELGPRAELDVLLPPGGPTTDHPALAMFAPGAHVAVGVRVSNLVCLRARYRLGISHSDLAVRGQPETTVLHRPGLELEIGW
jgi:hypothetical protein